MGGDPYANLPLGARPAGLRPDSVPIDSLQVHEVNGAVGSERSAALLALADKVRSLILEGDVVTARAMIDIALQVDGRE